MEENRLALRASEYVFFRDLFTQAAVGTVFVFTETTHRQWPDILRVAGEHAQVRASFPAVDHWNGIQLMLEKQGVQPVLKRGSSDDEFDEIIRPEHRTLLARFRRDSEYHESRMLRAARTNSDTSG